MERREEEDESINYGKLIPLDLIPDILLRLPAKSVVRFRCVSKLWSSITTSQDFIRSFAARSSARLCLLVPVKNELVFVSLPGHEHDHVNFFQVNPPGTYYLQPNSESVHGLVLCLGGCSGTMVWNLSMRQLVSLPNPKHGFELFRSFLGYDPVEDKYKVLAISLMYRDPPLVLTLGPQESWRVIQGIPLHITFRHGICIAGHVFYEARIRFEAGGTEQILVRFDVRYEKFKIIRKPTDDTLDHYMINYKGKLAWICSSSDSLRFWVLEDEEKQKWSLRNFLLPFPLSDPIWKVELFLRGVTHDTVEFIYIAPRFEAIYVLYYDPKRNCTRRVIYDGVGDKEFMKSNDFKTISPGDFYCYPNHIENLTSLENVSH